MSIQPLHLRSHVCRPLQLARSLARSCSPHLVRMPLDGHFSVCLLDRILTRVLRHTKDAVVVCSHGSTLLTAGCEASVRRVDVRVEWRGRVREIAALGSIDGCSPVAAWREVAVSGSLCECDERVWDTTDARRLLCCFVAAREGCDERLAVASNLECDAKFGPPCRVDGGAARPLFSTTNEATRMEHCAADEEQP